MRKIMVEKDTQSGEWTATFVGDAEIARCPTQDEAAEQAYAYARDNATEADPISVQIREEDGSFGPERTYPRAADPRRDPG